MYRQLLPLFFFLFSFVAAHAQQTERLIDNNPNYFYRGDQRPEGITAPADSNYMLVSYYQIAPNGVSQFGTLGTPVWIHRDSLISRGFFDGISGGGGSPFRTFYKELDFGEDYTLDIDTLDYYDQLILHAKPLTSDSTFITFPDIDDTDQYKGKFISIYSDGGELNALTIVDAAGNSVVNQVDCRFAGRYRFADTLRSERNGPVFANYRTDFEDDYTRVCEYVTEFSELNDTTDYTKTPGRIVYFGGDDEFWYVNQNGYWSNYNDKIKQNQYTIDSVQEIFSMNLELGDRIKVKGTGAEYLMQADSVAGYNIDTVAVVPSNAGYAVLNQEVKMSVFKGYSDDAQALQKAIDFAFYQTNAERNLNTGLYTGPYGGEGPFAEQKNNTSVIIDRNLDISFSEIDSFILYSGIAIEGLARNSTGLKQSPIVRITPSTQNQTIFTTIPGDQINGTYTYAAQFKNVQFQILDTCRAFAYVQGAVGVIADNVGVEARGPSGEKYIEYAFIINDSGGSTIKNSNLLGASKSSIKYTRGLNPNNPSNFGTNATVSNTKISYSTRAIEVDSAAVYDLHLVNNCSIELLDSNVITMQGRNALFVEGLYIERVPVVPHGSSLFRLGTTEGKNDESGYFAINNSKIYASLGTENFNSTMFQVDHSDHLIISNCQISNVQKSFSTTANSGAILFSGNYERNIDSTAIILKNSSTNSIHDNSKITILSSTDEFGANSNSIDSLEIINPKKISDGELPSSTGFYYISRSLDPNEKQRFYNNNLTFNNSANFNSNAYARLDFVRKTGSGNVSFLRGDELRMEPNSTGNISNVIGKTIGLNLLQSNSGNVTNYTSIRLEAPSRLSGGFVDNAYGVFIEDQGQSFVTNSYGLFIDDQDQATGDNFSIFTGTGTVHFGDSLYVEGEIESPTITTLKSQVTDLESETGWAQYTDDQYTSVSPLTVAAGDTATLFNNAASTITSDLPIGIDSLWNRTDSTIIGQYVGDAYTIRIDFTAESSSNDGYFDLGVDIGGTQNIIFQRIYAFPKGQDTPHRFSSTDAIYTLNTFIANGGKIKIIGGVGTTEIYDVNFVITRTHASPD